MGWVVDRADVERGSVRNPRLCSRSGAVLRIFDAHVHLFDCAANTHAFLVQDDPNFTAILGDYSTLPRRFLREDYLKASASCRVEGIVWHEFLAEDPVGEARWGQRLANASQLRQPMVVRVDFLDPTL